MKALLRKDIYVILTQFKLLFLVMIIFSVIPGGLFVPFTFIYSTMLSGVSIMSIDEQSKWDSLALMLPYSRGQLVTVKYIMGWLALAVALVLSAVCQCLWAALGNVPLPDGFAAQLFVFSALALVVQAVTLPVNFCFGIAKGRIATIVIVAFIGALVGATMGEGDGFYTLIKVTSSIPGPVYTVLAAALCAATIPISVAGFRRRAEK